MDRWHFLRPPAKPSIITLSSWGRCWVETRLTSLVGEGLGELLDLQLLKDLFWEAKGSLENKRQSREGPIGCLCTVLSNYKEGSGIPLTRWIGNILQTRYWAKKKKKNKTYSSRMRQSRPCGMCCNCEANSWRQKYPRIEYSREQNINTIRGYFSHLLLNNKLPQT